jgi:hypothetical protein
MKDQITKLGGWLTMLFSTVADEVAQDIQFIQRKRGFSAAKFVRTLVFGWMENPQAPLETLAEELSVSESALQQRMTKKSVALMRALLEKACAYSLAAAAENTELTSRFSKIYVEDCSSIKLLESLKQEFPGCGGAEKGQGAAGLKLFVRTEVTTGAMSVVKWASGREHDLNFSREAGDVPAGSLHLMDLGFWCPERLDRLKKHGVSWISRVPAGTTLSVDGQPREDLADFLKRQKADRVDQQVLLGEKAFSFRMVAVRCPKHIANERKRKLRKKSKKRGRQPTARQLMLCEWLVMVTSLSAEEFSIEELWTLYRVRWQIELVFKRWKSLIGLDKSRARTNGHRQLTELYAKLLGCLVTHWCGLLRAGLLTKLSWHQILKRAKRAIGSLTELWTDQNPDQRVNFVLRKLVKRLDRLKPRPKRNKKPGTMELLENPALAL